MAACSYPLPPEPDAEDPAAPVLRIVQPANGAQVSDLVDLRVKARNLELRSGLRFQIDDQVPVEYNPEGGVPSSLMLDTSRYSNGSHRLTVSIDTADGRTIKSAIDVRVDNPSFRIVSYRVDPFVQNGGEAFVDLELEGETAGLVLSADFSALDSAYQAGAETVESLSARHFGIRYPVSMANARGDGAKSVVVTARESSGGRAIARALSLSLRNTPPAPFEIKGATFVDAPAPTPKSGSPEVLSTIGAENLNLIGDEPGTFRIRWAGSPVPVERLLLTVSGYAGYYILPVDRTQTEVAVELYLPESPAGALPTSAAAQAASSANHFMSSIRRRAASTPIDTRLDFFGLGSSGSTAAISVPVNTTPIPPSVAKVTLKWSGAADLDLKVVEPGGEQISYQNPVSTASGGKLSLDSNYHCTPSDKPAETVSWPEGAGPASGTYKVRVTMYEGCANDPEKKLTSALSFDGEYTDCQGKPHPFKGSFPAGTAQGTSVEVASYDLQCPNWMHGNVSVERVIPPEMTAQWVRVPRTKIRALKTGDNTELAAGYTDSDGEYKLAFDTKGAKFYLQLDGEIDPAFAPAQVKDHRGRPQFWQSAELDPKGLPGSYNLEVKDAPGAILRAGAFRILQNLQNGISHANSVTGRDFKDCGRDDCRLTVSWEPAFINNAKGYSTNFNKPNWIFMCAGEENSPFSILHEYFHYVMTTWSVDDSPGEDHNLQQRSVPTLAWSEGVATYFAFRTMGVGKYYWVAPDGQQLASRDIYDPIPQGTDPGGGADAGADGGADAGVDGGANAGSDGGADAGGPVNDQSGNLSEGMVTQMLWEIRQETTALDRAIFKKMPSRFKSVSSSPKVDDGYPGADFIDFIDGLRGCDGAPSDDDLKALLKGPPAGHPEATHNMPYDWVNNTKI